jgi:hypothetical protein
MAQDTSISLTRGSWTQLTDADVTTITFQNKSSDHILVKVTAGATAPTDEDGSIRYNPGQGELNSALADLAPGISGTRVYAYLPTTSGKASAEVAVSHA